MTKQSHGFPSVASNELYSSNEFKIKSLQSWHKVVLTSIKYLGDKSIGTLPYFLLNKLCLGEHEIIDLRAAFVGSEHASGPHNDTGHKASSDTSVTLHGNVWFSENYKSGDVNLQVEDFNKTDETFCNANGAWLGCFGDIHSTCCKSDEKLLFGQEASFRKRLGIENFVDIAPPMVRN